MTYSYDKNSNMLTKKDYDGVVRHFRYNAENVQLVDPMEVNQAGLPVQRVDSFYCSSLNNKDWNIHQLVNPR